MAKAKKLPSGQWRTLVYSHTETANGKSKRVYESFTADSRKESEYLAAEFSMAKDQRQKPNSMTVKETVQAYIDSKSNLLSPATIRAYRSYLANHYKAIGDTPLSKLSQIQIQHEINSYAKDLSPKMIRNVYGLLSAALTMYYPSFHYKTTLPSKAKNELYVPSEVDIQTLIDASSEDPILRTAILLAATLGLRRGEICGLKWADIDWKQQTLVVKTSVVKNDAGDWVEKSPKSYAGNRTLSILDFLIPLLKNQQKGKLKGDSIIPLTPSTVSDRFVRVLSDAELPHFRFHDLRHYYASMMLSINVPDKYAMRRMGHATNDTLKNIYQHLVTDKEKAVTDSINKHLSEHISV